MPNQAHVPDYTNLSQQPPSLGGSYAGLTSLLLFQQTQAYPHGRVVCDSLQPTKGLVCLGLRLRVKVGFGREAVPSQCAPQLKIRVQGLAGSESNITEAQPCVEHTNRERYTGGARTKTGVCTPQYLAANSANRNNTPTPTSASPSLSTAPFLQSAVLTEKGKTLLYKTLLWRQVGAIAWQWNDDRWMRFPSKAKYAVSGV